MIWKGEIKRMDYPTIIVAHKIKNRVRLKLSLPLKEPKVAGKFLTEYDGIDSFQYNNISRSIVVNYNSMKVNLNEIIMRLSISYSKEYHMMPVNVFVAKAKNDTSLAYFSMINIIIGGLVKNLTNFKGKEIVNFLSWSAIGTTSLAILDHGYREIKEHGEFHPELVSSVYLFNAIKNGKLLSGSLITWLAAFGRHSLDLPYEGTTIKVKEFNNIFTGEPQYNISIYEGAQGDNGNINKIGILKNVLSNYIDKDGSKSKKSYYMGSKSILDSKEVAASELLGDSNNMVIKNTSEKFSI